MGSTPLWGFTYRLIADWLGLHDPHGSPERLGREMAEQILDYLLSQDLGLVRRFGESHVALIEHDIPVADVIEHLSARGRGIPHISSVEITPERIIIIGLGLDEYRIEGARR